MEKKLHTLPDLPYAYDALEPVISQEIMELHHDKHHAGYVKNLNDALEKFPELFAAPSGASLASWREKSAEELLMNLSDVPEEMRMAVRNNAGGHVNHSMFWEIMTSPGTGSAPAGALVEEINKAFGNFEEFKTKFNDAGAKRFGSGWVWLVKNKEGALEIISTANQDNPMSSGHQVIMGNDVWEHAYYLQYKNVRMDYLKAWWGVVNWKKVEEKFINLKS